jgi:hypothetical protein
MKLNYPVLLVFNNDRSPFLIPYCENGGCCYDQEALILFDDFELGRKFLDHKFGCGMFPRDGFTLSCFDPETLRREMLKIQLAAGEVLVVVNPSPISGISTVPIEKFIKRIGVQG